MESALRAGDDRVEQRVLVVRRCQLFGDAEDRIETLRELEVLIDGAHHHEYMLQIFLKESAGLYGDPSAGPFFYEIIQRKGDRGFGAGNFRALFESIEREQQKTGRI